MMTMLAVVCGLPMVAAGAAFAVSVWTVEDRQTWAIYEAALQGQLELQQQRRAREHTECLRVQRLDAEHSLAPPREFAHDGEHSYFTDWRDQVPFDGPPAFHDGDCYDVLGGAA